MLSRHVRDGKLFVDNAAGALLAFNHSSRASRRLRLTSILTLKIRAETDAMLGRDIRDGELFVGNATGALL